MQCTPLANEWRYLAKERPHGSCVPLGLDLSKVYVRVCVPDSPARAYVYVPVSTAGTLYHKCQVPYSTGSPKLGYSLIKH